MLFQSGSDVMLRAYSKVPHPHGTVLAADVFSSGIIGSDVSPFPIKDWVSLIWRLTLSGRKLVGQTDYGQFESYLNIAGLDLAIVDHSWCVPHPSRRPFRGDTYFRRLTIDDFPVPPFARSRYYHTSKDTLANLERGSTQHFGENVLAIVDELLGKESELSRIEIGVDLRQDYGTKAPSF